MAVPLCFYRRITNLRLKWVTCNLTVNFGGVGNLRGGLVTIVSTTSRAVFLFCFFDFNCSSSVRDVRKFKETKKHFDKVREDMEIAQVKNAQAPRNKPHEVEEATGALSISRKCFRHLALDYVLQVKRWRA